MLRCVLLAALAVALALPAAAQPVRKFTAQTLRGELVVTQPPFAKLNGQTAQLAPGARIRGADNMVYLSGAVAGKKLLVHYTLDAVGNLQDVWVLTPAEAARQPWPATAAQAATWRFNADAQVWMLP
ncbi:MAG: hypothetical protein JNM33_09975 [Rubrivivax sp.]|nr:hypothetical protein [Rubrivivax sp.]